MVLVFWEKAMYSRLLVGLVSVVLVSACSDYQLRPTGMQITEINRGVYSGIAGSDYTIGMIAHNTGRAMCGRLPRKLVVTPQEDGTKAFQANC